MPMPFGSSQLSGNQTIFGTEPLGGIRGRGIELTIRKTGLKEIIIPLCDLRNSLCKKSHLLLRDLWQAPTTGFTQKKNFKRPYSPPRNHGKPYLISKDNPLFLV